MTKHNADVYEERRATLAQLEPHLARGVDLEAWRNALWGAECAETVEDLRECLSNLPATEAANVLGQVVAMMRTFVPAELGRQLDGVMSHASDAVAGGPPTEPYVSPPDGPDWTWDPATGGPLGGTHPQDPEQPQGPETASEAAIQPSEVVPPAPGFGDDPDETQRAKVADFLAAAGNTGDAMDKREARPQSRRARGRVRKAASGG
jgi:hypothetical protein